MQQFEAHMQRLGKVETVVESLQISKEDVEDVMKLRNEVEEKFKQVIGQIQGLETDQKYNDVKLELKKLEKNVKEAEGRAGCDEEEDEDGSEEGEHDQTKFKGSGYRQNLTDRKGFQSLEKYGGETGELEDWSFEMEDVLAESEQRCESLLEVLKTVPDELDEDAVQKIKSTTKAFEWMND